jgi:hypothetical protein
LNRYGLGGLGTYRDVPYVTAEVNRLAEQLVWLARYPTEMGRARKQSFWVTLKHKITR